MSRKRKFLRLRVTTAREFLIDLDRVDGRTPDEIIQEWFKDFPMDQHHASRDACQVGYSEKLKSVENFGIVTEGDTIEPLPDPSS